MFMLKLHKEPKWKREREREEGLLWVEVVSPVILSQKERVGGSGGLCPSLGGHAHEGLGHGHGGRDPRASTDPSNGACPHCGHHAAHGGHSCQGDHGDGLSGKGSKSHGFSHAAETGGHGADTHLVECRGNWLAHLEGVGVGCWSRSRATC